MDSETVSIFTVGFVSSLVYKLKPVFEYLLQNYTLKSLHDL